MKNEIRRRILALRKAMPEYLLKEKSRIITKKVIDHPVYQQAELLFCYIDAKGEVMTSDLIANAWKSGKKVAVPRVHGDIMKFYFIESFKQLEKGCFGIMEPKCECRELTLVPDNSVVIMPGVAFDSKGKRIGYGKGYYDKYFSTYPDVYKIAIAFSMQIVPEIPSEALDVSADCVVTEVNSML